MLACDSYRDTMQQFYQPPLEELERAFINFEQITVITDPLGMLASPSVCGCQE